MWYSVAPDIAFDVPPAVVRTVRLPGPKPAPANPDWVPRGYIPWTCATPPEIHYVKPAPRSTTTAAWGNLPAVFWQNIKLPVKYEYSEKGALKYIAHKLHAKLLFTGPDYALVGAGIPFNKSAPAIVLLRDIATIPYIEGEVVVHPSVPRTVTVGNAPLDE